MRPKGLLLLSEQETSEESLTGMGKAQGQPEGLDWTRVMAGHEGTNGVWVLGIWPSSPIPHGSKISLGGFLSPPPCHMSNIYKSKEKILLVGSTPDVE